MTITCTPADLRATVVTLADAAATLVSLRIMEDAPRKETARPAVLARSPGEQTLSGVRPRSDPLHGLPPVLRRLPSIAAR